ncbi:MAG: hypothetical protein IKD74_01775 [Clostridia bacterium]|nr:hypothetical protein [Clostridia bacterium]
MAKQVKSHNEVMLVGRIINRQKDIRCNNMKSIRVKLALPNDLDYNLNPNIAFVYIYDDGEIFDKLKPNQAIAINGHIESNWGQRVIADVISLIKEPRRA